MARSHTCVRDLTVIFSRVDVSLIQRRFLFTTKRMTKTTTEDICATLQGEKKLSNSCVTRLRSHRLHFTVGSTEK